MSLFADYNDLSKKYDDTRQAQGAHLYLGLVYSLTKKTAENLHLLDLGCGTGTHDAHLLKEGLGKATVFDANVGMLDRAREKLKKYVDEGKVMIEQHSLPVVPYADNTFDVVMCNQVLHHLTDLDKGSDFSAVEKVIREAYRVLKPNGVFLVNLTTPFQSWNGFWFSKLFKESNKRFCNRLPGQETFLDMFRNNGFRNVGMLVEPMNTIIQEDIYSQEEGPLDEHWRKADSTTADVTPEDLENIVNQVTKMKNEGTLKEYKDEADSMRQHVGQYVVYYGKKV